MTNYATDSNDVSNCTMQKVKKATIKRKKMIAVLRDQARYKLRAIIYSLKNYSTQWTLIYKVIILLTD